MNSIQENLANMSKSGKMLMLKVANRHLPDTFWDIYLPNEMWNEIFAYVGGVERHPVAKLFWDRMLLKNRVKICLRDSERIWKQFYIMCEYFEDEICLDNAHSMLSRFSEDGYKYSLSNYEKEQECFYLRDDNILENGFCYEKNDDNDIISISCDKNHKLGKKVFYLFIEDVIINPL
jgi:hypothetical protein